MHQEEDGGSFSAKTAFLYKVNNTPAYQNCHRVFSTAHTLQITIVCPLNFTYVYGCLSLYAFIGNMCTVHPSFGQSQISENSLKKTQKIKCIFIWY